MDINQQKRYEQKMTMTIHITLSYNVCTVHWGMFNTKRKCYPEYSRGGSRVYHDVSEGISVHWEYHEDTEPYRKEWKSRKLMNLSFLSIPNGIFLSLRLTESR